METFWVYQLVWVDIQNRKETITGGDPREAPALKNILKKLYHGSSAILFNFGSSLFTSEKQAWEILQYKQVKVGRHVSNWL